MTVGPADKDSQYLYSWTSFSCSLSLLLLLYFLWFPYNPPFIVIYTLYTPTSMLSCLLSQSQEPD